MLLHIFGRLAQVSKQVIAFLFFLIYLLKKNIFIYNFPLKQVQYETFLLLIACILLHIFRRLAWISVQGDAFLC